MLIASIAGILLAGVQADAAPGQLTIIDKEGKPGALCPLKHTNVNAEIAGFGARVTVVQTFNNPSKTPIEAVYTFPLPSDSAVDRMRMRINDRIITGEIKRRDEARQIYEAAKARGQVAGLLDQERPNIFTQSVSNIMPGATIEVEISYVQLLKFEEGEFEFMFPMVVGPRFLGNTPDPEKINPPITPKGTRTGTNISLTVNIDAGAPIQAATSVLHAISTRKISGERVSVSLSRKDEIPNRDFILRYRCAGDSVTSAFLTHAGEKGGFFTLVLMPPKRPTAAQIAPKEVIFVMDQSGSQSGFPIEKSKELTLRLIDTLGPNDTFNVISFSNEAHALFPAAVPATESSVAQAKSYVKALQANGGTQLLQAVNAALLPATGERLRLVVFNTDGYVGNEFEILQAIREKRQNSRMFTFGIGNGVNRFLIDAMSAEGKGDAEYVTLAEKADGAVERFIKRTQNPVLTHVSVDFEGLDVSEVLPREIPDVFSEKPIVLKGRYSGAGKGTVVINGMLGGKPWSKRFTVELPKEDKTGSAIATLWAREKVDDLMRENWLAHVAGAEKSDVVPTIEALGMQFGIVTQYTSFVAVEQKVVNVGGQQRRVNVPIEMPEGVSYEGIFGDVKSAPGAPPVGRAGGGGIGGGGLSGQVAMKSDASMDLRTLEAQEKSMSPEERKKFRYETRVAKELREKSGKVEIQIWLKEWKQSDIDKLKSLGFKLEDKDQDLKILYGTCDAQALMQLVQVDTVIRIGSL